VLWWLHVDWIPVGYDELVVKKAEGKSCLDYCLQEVGPHQLLGWNTILGRTSDDMMETN